MRISAPAPPAGLVRVERAKNLRHRKARHHGPVLRLSNRAAHLTPLHEAWQRLFRPCGPPDPTSRPLTPAAHPLCSAPQAAGVGKRPTRKASTGVILANSPQARKRARQAERRRARNASHRSRVRTYVKRVVAAVEAGDREAASSALQLAEPVIDRMASKGILHKNKAARHKRRLAARIKRLSA